MSTIETQLLRYLLKKDTFNSFGEVARECFSTKDAGEFYELIKNYWDEITTTSETTAANILSFDILKRPGLKTGKREVQSKLAEKIDEIKFEDIEESIINVLLTRDLCLQLNYYSDKVISGESNTLDDIYNCLEEYETLSTRGDKSSFLESDSLSMEDLFDVSKPIPGLSWRLKCLNDSLGKLRKGNLIIFSSRPDGGKTAMLISESTFMFPQMKEGEKVYWFCNEEQITSIMKRIVSAHVNESFSKIAANRSKYLSDFKEVSDRFKIYHSGDMHIKDIEKVLRKGTPGLIVIDQVRKLRSPWDKDQEHLRLQKLFEWARYVAQTYGPVFAVHQAGASGDGRMYMQQSDLHGSKTDIQGEADAIIMIGRELDPTMENIRGISVVKNKMEQPEDESKRELKTPVNINRVVSRFYES